MGSVADDTERRRLKAIGVYDVLDTPPEQQFDDLVNLASQFCHAPIALMSLVDTGRVFFKARVGTTVSEIQRELAFCDHAIRRPGELMVVPDASKDIRFCDSPLVTGDYHLRFYAGMPLTTPTGETIGALCVLDTEARELSDGEADALKRLTRQVVNQLELRRTASENARLYVDALRTARRAEHAATHDDLTCLPNRTLFGERVAECIARSQTDTNFRYAVGFVDLDHFKVVNDGLGHAAGDLLLTTVGRRLTDALRTAAGTPMVARFGGDAFTVLLEDVADANAATRLLGPALTAITRPFRFGGHTLHPAASCGVVIGHSGYTKGDDLLRDADAALYRAKAAGRARVVVFDQQMHEAAIRRLSLEGMLREALDRHELILNYQPVVSLETRETVGFEALIRWKRDGRLTSPAEFIPLAEETGLIVPIGRWVLSEAVRQAAEWHRRYRGHNRPRMAVNVSRRQLEDEQLLPIVRRLLKQYSFDPSLLMLEITESTIMGDADTARGVLKELRGLGVKLAIDDFGTGYSSLSCLHEFDLDVLKLDRSFVAGLGNRRESAILRAVMELSHGLGMSVVAEGIETAEQMAFLRATDCDFGQGYLFAKPLGAAAAEAYLTTPMLKVA